MLEPYDGKLSRTVLRREGGGNTADPADYSPLVNRLKGQVVKISPNSTQFINPMDINANYSPVRGQIPHRFGTVSHHDHEVR